ncbi:MAG: TetR/AcrR family transcriptional regulator [Heyndrickxia sp.]
MNDRKQHVIKMAHQLFIEKGFHATSIQDILDYSGISKGTFYNYFSSKKELLMAIFNSLHEILEVERNKLMIGQDPSDKEIFIKQIELQMKLNKQNKLFALFEEILVSNDTDFKDFLKQMQLNQLNWTFYRLVDIYGEDKNAYLLDCTILFTGMLHHQFHVFFQQKQPGLSVQKIIRYCINRLSRVVEEVSSSGEQLHDPRLMAEWFPTNKKNEKQLVQKKIEQSLINIKRIVRKECHNDKQQLKWIELLDFLQEEVLHSKQPRVYLVKSALDSLVEDVNKLIKKELNIFIELVHQYIDPNNSDGK